MWRPYGDGVTEPPEAAGAAAQPAPGARTGSSGGSGVPPPGGGSGRAGGVLPRSVTARATGAGALVSLLLVVAIVLGSRLLENFDSALLPYAVASVFLAFGVAYRYTVWVSAPGVARLFKKGWGSLFSVANFRRTPTALPKMIAPTSASRSSSAPAPTPAGPPTS